jgi:hypothetical protein
VEGADKRANRNRKLRENKGKEREEREGGLVFSS